MPSYEVIGTAITAIALLATAIATFFSRQQAAKNAELEQLRQERMQLRAEVLAGDAEAFRLKRLLKRNGIEDEHADRTARDTGSRHHRRARPDDGDHAAR